MEDSRPTIAVTSRPTRILVIMAKAPRRGRVKTRLMQSLPAEAVTTLYRCLLEDTVALAKSLAGVEATVMCPENDREELVELLGDRIQIVPQKGEGLAAGLTSVFRHFIAEGREHVIAFNSDSPHIAPSVLTRAFETLATHDMVVGPTHDGGYYLVGAKAVYPTLFEGDGMGTETALDRLLSRTKALGLSTGFTEGFYDVDLADDLIRLAGELRSEPKKAPKTAEWLDEWAEEVARLPQRNRQAGQGG